MITVGLFFVTAFLVLACFTQSAWAHDPPVITPTRLEFDASQTPKKCNDRKSFKSILEQWVPPSTWHDDAERRLVVRISWSTNAGKRVDMSVIDAQGNVQAERHTPYSAATECHKVLYDTAYDAAQMLGAFEPPPPKEPVTCPAPLPTPPPTPCPQSPPMPALLRTEPIMIPHPPTPSRFSLGLGVFVGPGIGSNLSAGPLGLLDVVPASRLSQLHIEFEGYWTSQKVESTSLHSIPFVASACWAHGIVRFCGGFSATILSSNQSPNHESRIIGANFRVATELFDYGPFSIRADVFARLTLTEPLFGQIPGALAAPTPMTGGVTVMGIYAFD